MDKVFEMKAEAYMRDGVEIITSVEPLTSSFKHHWWSDEAEVASDTTFICTLPSYSNANDYLISDCSADIASEKILSVLAAHCSDLEVYQTTWLNATDEFIERDFRVFRLPSKSNLLDITRSRFRKLLPLVKSSSLMEITDACFICEIDGAARPSEFSHKLYVSKLIMSLIKGSGARGVNFVEQKCSS